MEVTGSSARPGAAKEWRAGRRDLDNRACLGGKEAGDQECIVYEEWTLAALIFALPIALFLLFELFGVARSWRLRSQATRRKGPKAR